MITILVLVIYILGAVISYEKLLEWSKESIKLPEDFQTLHMVSLLSWFAFVFYGITRLMNDSEES